MFRDNVEKQKNVINELKESLTSIEILKEEIRNKIWDKESFSFEFFNYFRKCNERIHWNIDEDNDDIHICSEKPVYKKIEKIESELEKLIEKKESDLKNYLKSSCDTIEDFDYAKRELLIFEISEIEKNTFQAERNLELFSEHMSEITNFDKNKSSFNREHKGKKGLFIVNHFDQEKYFVSERNFESDLKEIIEYGDRKKTEYHNYIAREEKLLSKKREELQEVIDNIEREVSTRISPEILASVEAEKLKIEEERQKRKEEAEERQRQRDYEIRKLELELQLKQNQLDREREEREMNRATIEGLKNTLRDG